jgi:hypothetical protein
MHILSTPLNDNPAHGPHVQPHAWVAPSRSLRPGIQPSKTSHLFILRLCLGMGCCELRLLAGQRGKLPSESSSRLLIKRPDAPEG